MLIIFKLIKKESEFEMTGIELETVEYSFC